MKHESFAERLLSWYQHQGRKNLPWQQNPTPYRVWVSEIMLQQTQVATVIDYYQRFMQSFPDIFTLASASQEQVLHHWAGLGYYSRARNLHRCAQILVQEYQGHFPLQDQKAMEALPGIGPSTAAAIIALSSDQRAVILDGNVKRVVARYFALEGWPGKTAINRLFWKKADELTPATRAADYTQAIMDLGATLCTPRQPQCSQCPVKDHCKGLLQDKVSQLPSPKPKKALPTQERHFLVLNKNSKELLLQQRPQDGIWGGLWCLPDFTTREELEAWLTQTYPQARLEHQGLEPVKHVFSHYRLLIRPWQAHLADISGIQEEAQTYSPSMAPTTSLWYNPRQPANVGLPAPIKKLLEGIQL
ncbi:A/G-specific DNA-adenine glycosylase [Marinospirillum celere]|uniref:Adenine DNA glycosylase n=1 Tax=Marinospirillum celere TaxID=1122252 RepID=A0A1I1HS40_9GAMM|nr:A/G-specific adenine glycosylase [Marinospirillum celere]SFC26681.1 A/G-specific DNA-adenine glycosylase [Marinospirillum celere]